jgi:hypothetical protein
MAPAVHNPCGAESHGEIGMTNVLGGRKGRDHPRTRARLIALVDRGTSLHFSTPALDEVVGEEEPSELLIDFGERRRFGLVHREVSGLQGGPDAEPRGDLLG